MLSPKHVYETLLANRIDFFAGVPDSLLKAFCAYVTDHTEPSRNIITANEGGAIALAAGHYMATGNPALVYMQNSGLGNTFNPLTSLADPDVYGFPMLLVVGWRGEPGKKDEPQHVKMGKVTVGTLDVLGIPHALLPETEEEAAGAIITAVETMHEQSAPYALVVKKGTFEPYTLQSKADTPYPMTREEALAQLLDALEPGTPIVSTTGKASREIFELREKRGEGHDSDFLTVGSMGHCSHIALGAALSRPDRDLYCVDGDGAVIMHLGGLAIIAAQKPANFKHVVLNNGAHDSVGGQPTVGFDVDICAAARACGYQTTLCAENADQLRDQLEALKRATGPALLEVRVKKGARKELGRPTHTPHQAKALFMEFLRR